jgi:hypothetical protein
LPGFPAENFSRVFYGLFPPDLYKSNQVLFRPLKPFVVLIVVLRLILRL